LFFELLGIEAGFNGPGVMLAAIDFTFEFSGGIELAISAQLTHFTVEVAQFLRLGVGILLALPGHCPDLPQFGLEPTGCLFLAIGSQFLHFLLDPASAHAEFLGVFLGEEGKRGEHQDE
jgi:hypothetical protein